MSSSIPDLEQDYSRLLAAFEAIAAISSRLRREFTLSRTAAYHGLSKAEARRMFQLWLLERVGGSNDA